MSYRQNCLYQLLQCVFSCPRFLQHFGVYPFKQQESPYIRLIWKVLPVAHMLFVIFALFDVVWSHLCVCRPLFVFLCLFVFFVMLVLCLIILGLPVCLLKLLLLCLFVFEIGFVRISDLFLI